MLKIIVSLAGIQFLQAAIQILKMKFVSIMLGPEGLGVISLINQFVQLVLQLSTIALPWVATRYMAVAYSHNQEAFDNQVKVFFRGIFYLSTLGMGIGSIFIWKYSSWLDPQFQSYQMLGMVSICMVMPIAMKGFLLSVFTTAGRYRFSAFTLFYNVIISTIAMLIGAYTAGLKGFFIAQAVTEYGMLFYCFIKLESELGIRPFSGEVGVFKELRKLKGSFELILYGSVLYFLSPMALMALRYALLKNGGEQLVGVYQAVHGLALYITMALGQATNLYLEPILKRDISLDEKIATANQYLRSLSLVMGSIGLFLAIFPETVVRAMYSPAFIDGAGFLYAFVAIESINVISSVYLSMLVGQGWYKSHFILGLVGHSSIGVLSYLLVPDLGVWGVIVALGANAFFTIALIYGRIFKEAGSFISLRQIFVPALNILAIVFVGYWVSSMEQHAHWIPVKCEQRILVVLIYWAIIWFMLSTGEKKRIIGKLRSVVAG